jgi:hypothetical protein
MPKIINPPNQNGGRVEALVETVEKACLLNYSSLVTSFFQPLLG